MRNFGHIEFVSEQEESCWRKVWASNLLIDLGLKYDTSEVVLEELYLNKKTCTSMCFVRPGLREMPIPLWLSQRRIGVEEGI